MQLNHYERYLLELTNELIRCLVKAGATIQDAQDIAQDALLKILEIDNVIPSNKIRAWLYRVAINLYYNLYDRKKRYQELLTLHFSPHFENEMEADYEMLYGAFKQMDVRAANLLLMKYEQELSLDEIVLILERPKESLKTELYRARKKLKLLLEEGEDYNDRT